MASISSLTFLMRRGLDCRVLTPAAVTFVRRTYVATALLQPHTRTRAYADVHSGSGRSPPPQGPSAPRRPPAPEGVIRSAADRSSRERDQRTAPRDRAPRRGCEGPGPGPHRLPSDAARTRGAALLEARRRRPHQLLAGHRDGVRGPQAHRRLAAHSCATAVA